MRFGFRKFFVKIGASRDLTKIQLKLQDVRNFGRNFEIWMAHTYVNLVNLVKTFLMRICLQKWASIQPRTSRSNCADTYGLPPSPKVTNTALINNKEAEEPNRRTQSNSAPPRPTMPTPRLSPRASPLALDAPQRWPKGGFRRPEKARSRLTEEFCSESGRHLYWC